MNAISTLGVVIGANGAAALWELYDIRSAVVFAGVDAALAGLTLSFLPRRPKPLPAVDEARAA